MLTTVNELLGLHTPPTELTVVQMSLRALVVVLWGIFIIRIGDGRLLGRNAGFDVLLIVILGSVLSRGINGQAAFFPTLGVSAVLILIHHLLALVASGSDSMSRLLKGSPRVLVRHGKLDRVALKRSRITAEDLEENLRLNGNVAGASEVLEARLERNGVVSVVKK